MTRTDADRWLEAVVAATTREVRAAADRLPVAELTPAALLVAAHRGAAAGDAAWRATVPESANEAMVVAAGHEFSAGLRAALGVKL